MCLPLGFIWEDFWLKHKLLFTVTILADLLLPLMICLLWRRGALLVMPLFIMSHLFLGRLNECIGKTHHECWVLGIAHIVSTLCAHLLFQWLWSTYVYHGNPDDETIGAEMLAIIVGLSITIYLLIRSLSIDEARHGKAFAGLLKRCFGK